MSQLVFQEDITIFETNNFLASQHRSLAAFPGSARQRCFLGMCAVSSPGLLRLPGVYYDYVDATLVCSHTYTSRGIGLDRSRSKAGQTGK